MGCWNETCGFTSLPIYDNDPVRVMIIKRAKRPGNGGCYTIGPFDLYVPASFLVTGKYNDYGGVHLSDDQWELISTSARACDVNLDREHDEGKLGIPDNHSLWFIREDSYQMLATLPIESFRDGVQDVQSCEASLLENLATALEDYKEIKKVREYPDSSTIRSMFRDEVYEGVITETLMTIDPLLFEERYDEAVSVLSTLLPILRIQNAMGESRRNLMPAAGVGSQSAALDAHDHIARFVLESTKKQRHQYD